MTEQNANIGRGLVHINLRLTRILEVLEQGGVGGGPSAGATDGVALEMLLDLVEAVERTLEAEQPATTPSWWQQLLGATPPPAPDNTGLRLALGRCHEALRGAGLQPSPREGKADPHLHQVIETRVTTSSDLHQVIAHTHRRGWHRAGEASNPVRLAQISAWRHEDP